MKDDQENRPLTSRETLDNVAPPAPPNIDALVGSRLRSLRLERNLSTDAAAALANIPTESLVQYEAGESRIPPAVLMKLVDRFNISFEEIFSV